MSRTAVYCFYNPKGKLDDEDIYLLKELKSVASSIIFVANGTFSDERVYHIAKKVIVRKNSSYDAGAYADVLKNTSCKRIIDMSDELILCNSSFFGPFIPFKSIFDEMEQEVVDFWGLIRINDFMHDYGTSFFVVYRKRILEANMLDDYFSKYVFGQELDYLNVCSVFENGLHHYLIENGYSYGSYCKEPMKCGFYSNSYGSLCIDKLPILKKRVFEKGYYRKGIVEAAISYILANYDYPVDTIIKSAKANYKRDIRITGDLNRRPYIDVWFRTDRLNRKEIVEFIDSVSKYYVYGAGEIGKEVYQSIIRYPNNKKMAGYVVTDVKDNNRSYCGYRVLGIDNLNIADNEGVIVAMSEEHSAEILDRVKGIPNVLFLWKRLNREIKR